MEYFNTFSKIIDRESTFRTKTNNGSCKACHYPLGPAVGKKIKIDIDL